MIGKSSEAEFCLSGVMGHGGSPETMSQVRTGTRKGLKAKSETTNCLGISL